MVGGGEPVGDLGRGGRRLPVAVLLLPLRGRLLRHLLVVVWLLVLRLRICLNIYFIIFIFIYLILNIQVFHSPLAG